MTTTRVPNVAFPLVLASPSIRSISPLPSQALPLAQPAHHEQHSDVESASIFQREDKRSGSGTTGFQSSAPRGKSKPFGMTPTTLGNTVERQAAPTMPRSPPNRRITRRS